MKTGAEGVALIKKFEGLELRAYQDSVGVWTVGYGHTRTAEPEMEITPSDAERLLREDLEDTEKAVSHLVKVPLNQDEFDALVSFTFNLGSGNLQHSTLLRKLNASNKVGASAEFTRWVYAGGVMLKGLKRRRLAEQALFRGEDWDEF